MRLVFRRGRFGLAWVVVFFLFSRCGFPVVVGRVVLVLGVGVGRVVFGGGAFPGVLVGAFLMFLGCFRRCLFVGVGAFLVLGAFGVVIVFLCAGRARGRVVLVRGSVARARGFLVWCVLDCSFLVCPVLGVTFRRVGLCLFGRVSIVGGTDGTGYERAREPCAKTPLVR